MNKDVFTYSNWSFDDVQSHATWSTFVTRSRCNPSYE